VTSSRETFQRSFHRLHFGNFSFQIGDVFQRQRFLTWLLERDWFCHNPSKAPICLIENPSVRACLIKRSVCTSGAE